ncbi:MAG: hypothetical protein ABR579_01490 [Actinomycetota bacterium]
MKKASLLALAALATGLLMPSVAYAKGAQEITITGPQMEPITLHGEGHTGTFGTTSGFWAEAFQTYPDPTTKNTTATELGPRYEAAYLMVAPQVRKSTVVQDIYPYAKPYPQTYIAPNQFVMGGRTKGGWYTAGPDLVRFLKSHGLPSSATLGGMNDSSSPSPLMGVTGAAVPPSSGSAWWMWIFGGLVFLIFVAGAIARTRRVRSLPTAT